MVEQEAVSRLRGLVRKWSKKNGGKLIPGIIGEIHELVVKNDCKKLVVINLIEVKCFENLLWKFYDEDSSVNHIELIIMIALVKYEREEYGCFDEIIEDSRFDDFFTRVLSIVNGGFQTEIYRFSSFVFEFIGVLITRYRNHPKFGQLVFPIFDIYTWSNYTDLVKDSYKLEIETKLKNIEKLSKKEQLIFRLKNDWFYSIINGLKTSRDKSSEFQSYLLQFLRLLLRCITQDSTNKYFPNILKFSLFPYQVKIMQYSMNNSFIKEINDLIIHYLYFSSESNETDAEKFYKLQVYLSTQNDFPKTFDFTPSINNILVNEMKCYLEKLKIEGLLKIVEKFNIARLSKPHSSDILVEIILSYIFPPNFQQESISHALKNVTEIELFDDFEIKSNNDILNTNVPMSDMEFLNYQDYFNRVLLHLRFFTLKKINRHIKQVFSRIENSNLQIKGKSKYFHHIGSILKLEHGLYQLDTKECINSKYLLLVELIVPTKFSKNKRLSIHGINKLRWAEVIKTENKSLTIKCSNTQDIEEFEERFKYFLTLPVIQTLHTLINLLSFDVVKDYHHCFENVDKLINTRFTYSDISSGNHIKRLKCGVEDYHKSDNLNQDEIEFLQASLQSNCSFVEVSKFSRIELLVERLYETFNKARTLILAPNSACVNQSKLAFDNDFIRYGSARDIKSLENKCSIAIHKLKKTLKHVKFNEEFEMKKIDLYENRIKSIWSQYLNQYSKENSSYLLHSYPFDDCKYKTFESIVQSYLSILKSIEFLRLIKPISDRLDEHHLYDKQLWNYIYNKFDIIISLEDYVNIHNEADLVLKEFHNIILLFGKHESLATLLKNSSINKIKKLIMLGGQISTNFKHQVIKTESDTRPEFSDNKVNLVNPPKLNFNPGFQLNSTVIRVSNQLEEAEYCVLLYQYMRLLGYPAEEIIIWVTCLQQKALIEEIVRKKFQYRASNDSKDSFEFGWPQVICNIDGEYNYTSCNYVIESLHTNDNLVYPITSFMGKLGNYSVGMADASLKTPISSNLQIHTNENYWCTTRSKQSFSIENKDHLLEYVVQMTKTRTGN